MADCPARIRSSHPPRTEERDNLDIPRMNAKPVDLSNPASARKSLHRLLPAFKDTAHRNKLARPFALQRRYPFGRI
jgi:hypothetical protein